MNFKHLFYFATFFENPQINIFSEEHNIEYREYFCLLFVNQVNHTNLDLSQIFQ